jgi:hypothetical protein
VLCRCPWAAKTPSQLDLKPANQQGILAKKCYTQPTKMRENPCFLGQEFSVRKREYMCKNDLSKHVMLAENECG